MRACVCRLSYGCLNGWADFKNLLADDCPWVGDGFRIKNFLIGQLKIFFLDQKFFFRKFFDFFKKFYFLGMFLGKKIDWTILKLFFQRQKIFVTKVFNFFKLFQLFQNFSIFSKISKFSKK